MTRIKNKLFGWSVSGGIVILAITIFTIFIALAFFRAEAVDDQRAEDVKAAVTRERAICVEFRTFMGEYLASQVGRPPSELDGFDELPANLQELILALEPVLGASREQDRLFAENFVERFPPEGCVPTVGS